MLVAMLRVIPKRLRRMRLRLVPLLPAIVVVVGLATAVAVGFLALWHLRTTSDQVADTRASVLASALGARLRATSPEDRLEFVRRAARRTGAELLVCTQDGGLQVDATFGPPTRSTLVALLVQGKGETRTRIGRTRFSAKPLGAPFQNLSVVVFVPAPAQPEGALALLRSIAGLVWLTRLRITCGRSRNT